MKKLTISLFFVFTFTFTLSVNAQTEALELRLDRDWGYGGFSGDIQGRFSLKATGPDGLVEVQFIIDDIVVATVTEPPFNYQFETDEFTPGTHTLTAVGTLSNGTQLAGPKFQRVFLSAEEAREATLSMIVPLLVGLGGIIVLAAVFPVVFSRKLPYQFKQYGVAGGAVCPRCLLPFSRNIFSPNLIYGKLARCPHCGKWAIVRRATPQELAAAEERFSEARADLQLDPNAQAAQMRKALEDTRYDK